MTRQLLTLIAEGEIDIVTDCCDANDEFLQLENIPAIGGLSKAGRYDSQYSLCGNFSWSSRSRGEFHQTSNYWDSSTVGVLDDLRSYIGIGDQDRRGH